MTSRLSLLIQMLLLSRRISFEMMSAGAVHNRAAT